MSMGKFDVRIKCIEVVHELIKFVSATHPYEKKKRKMVHINKTWLSVLITGFLKIYFPLATFPVNSTLQENSLSFDYVLTFLRQ